MKNHRFIEELRDEIAEATLILDELLGDLGEEAYNLERGYWERHRETLKALLEDELNKI